MTYSSTIYADIEYSMNGQIVKRDNVQIGKIPIMLRSTHCFLYQKSHKEIVKMRECPMDPGGYFIIRGVERVILMQEQIMSNKMMLDSLPDDEYMCSIIRFLSSMN
ncbi:DNA-directed RNA polymerase III subunit RPC2 [Thelohanellus kitauei]|uniref:DNA-directed RNA polymerase n=1 Tax=Thelohanellus kitauei TaxID=669202 RepID=A0A0C2M2P1_THEKT|nr:DNA-directed RNA polymerase III subunit RPC2 [Thelohanellus kitauei]